MVSGFLGLAAAQRRAGGGCEPQLRRLAGKVGAPLGAGQVAEGRDFFCISFLGAPRGDTIGSTGSGRRGDLALLRSDDTHVLSISRWVGKSSGSPNAWLERHLGEPATTRNWRTVVRLVEKHR